VRTSNLACVFIVYVILCTFLHDVNTCTGGCASSSLWPSACYNPK